MDSRSDVSNLHPRGTTDISHNYSNEDVVANFTESYQQIVSDDVLVNLNVYVFLLLFGLTAVSGFISNLFNTVIFFNLGVHDSMGVCLFALSLTDFLLSCIIVLSRVFHTWKLFDTGHGIDPLALNFVSTPFAADFLFLCSGWILTFLSIERCVCVVFPFKVKRLFTRNRAVVTVIGIYTVVVSAYIPIYATQWLGWTSVELNGTITKRRLRVMFSHNRPQIQRHTVFLISTAIPVPAMIITFGSVLWMVYGLITSSKKRHSLISRHAEPGEKDQGFKVSPQTRRLVKMVLVLAVTFLLCSIPRMIGNYIRMVYPEIDKNGKEENVNKVIWNLARFSSCINSSINIIVYLKINSSYREKFKELMVCITPKK